jgi:hypothetical protein
LLKQINIHQKNRGAAPLIFSHSAVFARSSRKLRSFVLIEYSEP